MTPVAQALSELLFERDAVTVPGLGTFSCEYGSAKVNVITNQFERPSSTIHFNAQQRGENDQLVRYLTVNDAVSEEEARQHLLQFVTDCFTELKSGRDVELPGIGTLSMDAGQALHFAPSDSNFNGDAFGLTDFTSAPVFGGNKEEDWKAQVARQLKEQNTPMTVDRKAVHEDLGDEQSFHRHRRRLWLRVLLTSLLMIFAVVVLLFILEVIHFDLPVKPKPVPPVPPVTVPVPDSAMQSQLVRYYPAPVTEPEETAPDANPEPIDANPEPTDVNPEPTDVNPEPPITNPEPAVTDSEPAVTRPETGVMPYESLLPYSVIGGCFSLQTNAENYIAPIHEAGYSSAFLMLKGDKYYVCYGHYPTMEEALKALTDIKANSNAKAWILTK